MVDHTLYRINNNINNREYIGVTNNFNRRMAEHKRNPYNKIKKDFISWDDFSFNKLLIGNENYCYNMEIEYIKKYNPYYNTSKGGKVTEGHQGSEHWNSQLKEIDILDIRKLVSKGIKTKIIAETYNTDMKNISKIARGDTWKHVGGPITKLNNINGSNNPMAKLTAESIIEIRELYATKNYTQKVIGDKYNISYQHVSDIIRGNKWQSIGGPIKGVDYD